MTEHETLIYGGMVFALLLFAASKIGSKSPQLPPKPEPLQPQARQVNPADIQASFDSASLQTARGIVSEIEKYADPQAKTLLLADYLHRAEQYRERQNGRQQAELKKEADIFEKALVIADRISGRNVSVPPPPPVYRPEYPDDRQPQRINHWVHRREIPGDPGMFSKDKWNI
ncbi:MAG: hypothetical protein V2I97_17650 [Desulfococcaceae bacterium]|jgi:hypothetical protein|nr:hypothetical protein [Desulfococcaceae bacterium]